MAAILGTRTIENVVILLVDSNPAAGIGTIADPGSFATVNDGSGVYFKSGIADTAWSSLVGCIFTNTANSATINTTAAETSFSLTAALPANTLNRVGRQVRLKVWGTFGNTGTPTITTRLKNGATTLAATPAITMGAATAQGFIMEAIITVRSVGAGGTISRNISASFNDTGATTERMSIVASNGTIAFNTTIANTLGFSVQWSASNIRNTITIENMTCEILN